MATICIEGLVGSGKSTAANCIRLYEENNVYLFDEPLQDFSKFETVSKEVLNPLAEYYKNPSQNSTTCQLHILDVYEERLKTASKLPPKTIKVWDRGIDSSHVFSMTQVKLGHMTKLSYEYWLKCFHRVSSKYDTKVDGIFFLDTPITDCINRQEKRGRQMERDFQDQMRCYMKVLRETYLDYLHEEESKRQTKVHIVEGSHSIQENQEALLKFIGDIEKHE